MKIKFLIFLFIFITINTILSFAEPNNWEFFRNNHAQNNMDSVDYGFKSLFAITVFDGKVYCGGSNGGLNIYDMDNKNWERITKNNKLIFYDSSFHNMQNHINIHCMDNYKLGIFMGTDNGFIHLTKNDTIMISAFKNKFPNPKITNMTIE